MVRLGTVHEIWRYPVKSMAGERLGRTAVGERGLYGDRGWAVLNDATGEIHNAKRFPVLMQCAARYRAEPGADDVPDVDITFPDGTTLGSDSPVVGVRLSELMEQRVSLRRIEPATNKAFYRRRQPGAALIGKLAAWRTMRRIIQRAAESQLRPAFGREPNEPMPDLSDLPGSAFEFYTPPGTFFDVAPIHVLTTSTLAAMAALNSAASWDVRRFRPNILLDTTRQSAAYEHDWIGHTIRIGGFAIRGEMRTIRCAMTMHPQVDLPRDPSVLRTIVRDADQCLGLYASIVATGIAAIGDPVSIT